MYSTGKPSSASLVPRLPVACSLVPRPSPSFLSLAAQLTVLQAMGSWAREGLGTASDGKLGEGLGTASNGKLGESLGTRLIQYSIVLSTLGKAEKGPGSDASYEYVY